MATKHSMPSIGLTATSVTGGVVDTSGNNYDVSRRLVITNTSTDVMHFGDSTVTTTSYGFKLAAGAQIQLTLSGNDDLYAVTAGAGASAIAVLHTSV